uniref:Fatty acyl-CoA reductase n=1 Tax=Timema poppense TaxID=170557 RepID=A0A7R9CNN0_TIMPO|nr:unnamed protein product [Timema poppensis]
MNQFTTTSLVYLSTAYSNCNRKDIEECFYDPPLEDDGVINFLATVNEAIMETIKPKQLQDPNIYTEISPMDMIIDTWPNTYTFTKAIAESIIRKTAGDLPIAIVRPSQVSTSLKEPVCGWIDNVYGPNGAAAGIFAGLVRTGISHAEVKLNMVPVDMVANCIIAAAFGATTSIDFLVSESMRQRSHRTVSRRLSIASSKFGWSGILQGTRQEEGISSDSDVDVEGTDDEEMEDQGQEGGPSNTNPILSIETDETFEPVSGLKRKLRTRLGLLQDQTATSQTGQPSGGMKESSTPWRIKTPPVVVTNVTQYNNVIKLLNSGLQDDYKVYCIAQRIKVVTTSFRDYSTMLKLLKQNTLEHFTYLLPKNKPFKAVIKGLHTSMPSSDIKVELENRGFTPTDVRQLYSKSSPQSRTPRPLPMFVCTLVRTEGLENYRNSPIYLRELEKKNQVSEKKIEGETKVASPAAHVAGNRKPSTGQQSSANQPKSAVYVGLNQPSYSGVVKKIAKKDKQENRSSEESSDLEDLLQILKEINVGGLLQLLRKYLLRLKNAPDKTT